MNAPSAVVRTRIAPSPTGEDLHIGNAYTALINYVFAKKHNGQFLVRIEDTDRTRLVDGAEKRILASLAWLGIPHDEGPDKGGPHTPYRQSERLSIYKKYAEELVSKGHAYYCFCTPDRLADMRKAQEAARKPPMYDGTCRNLTFQNSKLKVDQGERHVIRMKVPKEGTTTFVDLIRGDISFENTLIDDQVLLKSDGYPTYHLGVVVDDHLMGISHIIRGEEWIPSTPKHVLLYGFLGWSLPTFAHVSVLRKPDKSKLSKRKNPVWVSWFRSQGYLPEAIRNYLATMAWAHPDGKEVFDTDELVQKFTLEAIQTTAPVFDMQKLRWFNGEYIRTMSDDALKKLLREHISMLAREYDTVIDKILPLVKERMKTLSEFWSLAGFFFDRPREFEIPCRVEPLQVLKETLTYCEWKHDTMETSIREAAQKAQMQAKDVFMQLRVAVTGRTVGPPLLESLEILGREEVLARLLQAKT